MEIIEAFFLVVGLALTVSQIYIIKGYFKYKELSKSSAEIEEKIKQLVESGFFDSEIFYVKKFNHWFKNNKDKEIYAHAGIFLRTDKLSRGHINDYIKVITKGLLSSKDFDELLIMKFEDKIRKDWMKQLSSGNQTI